MSGQPGVMLGLCMLLGSAALQVHSQAPGQSRGGVADVSTCGEERTVSFFAFEVVYDLALLKG